ncbi:CocE/NonD family hydrolase C-terminal non-catalytic domain-containing protein [Streptomyces sp. PGLac3x]
MVLQHLRRAGHRHVHGQVRGEALGGVAELGQCPPGRLRVSLRHLDEELSTEDVPAHTFDRTEKLASGEIVDVEIDLLPLGLTFHPGEQLRLVVRGRPLLGTMMPGNREYTPANEGQHLVHTGGDHASYLRLSVRTA